MTLTILPNDINYIPNSKYIIYYSISNDNDNKSIIIVWDQLNNQPVLSELPQSITVIRHDHYINKNQLKILTQNLNINHILTAKVIDCDDRYINFINFIVDSKLPTDNFEWIYDFQYFCLEYPIHNLEHHNLEHHNLLIKSQTEFKLQPKYEITLLTWQKKNTTVISNQITNKLLNDIALMSPYSENCSSDIELILEINKIKYKLSRQAKNNILKLFIYEDSGFKLIKSKLPEILNWTSNHIKNMVIFDSDTTINDILSTIDDHIPHFNQWTQKLKFITKLHDQITDELSNTLKTLNEYDLTLLPHFKQQIELNSDTDIEDCVSQLDSEYDQISDNICQLQCDQLNKMSLEIKQFDLTLLPQLEKINNVSNILNKHIANCVTQPKISVSEYNLWKKDYTQRKKQINQSSNELYNEKQIWDTHKDNIVNYQKWVIHKRKLAKELEHLKSQLDINKAPHPQPIIAEDPQPIIAKDPKPIIAKDPKPIIAEDPQPIITEDPQPIIAEDPQYWQNIYKNTLIYKHILEDKLKYGKYEQLKYWHQAKTEYQSMQKKINNKYWNKILTPCQKVAQQIEDINQLINVIKKNKSMIMDHLELFKTYPQWYQNNMMLSQINDKYEQIRNELMLSGEFKLIVDNHCKPDHQFIILLILYTSINQLKLSQCNYTQLFIKNTKISNTTLNLFLKYFQNIIIVD